MKRVLVTGGGGFVGSALVAALCDKNLEVLAAGRNRYPHLEKLGVTCFQGDISQKSFTDRICTDIDTVFHTAAKAGIWGSWEEYEQANITGTKNIVDSCLMNNVQRLVYTSTPSVVFSAADICKGDEGLSYSAKPLCSYARSKIIAERYVLAQRGTNLKLCSLRPHLIWGPKDPHLIPRLLAKGRQKALKIVGNGLNLVDITYIDNVVHAHLLAAENLASSCEADGKAYFIGQEKPVNLWHWINELYEALDIEPITKRVALPIAYCGGAVLEFVYTLLNRQTEPKMTRFLALQLARSHYFSHERAHKDFGYQPIVSLSEGQKKLIEWVKLQV